MFDGQVVSAHSQAVETDTYGTGMVALDEGILKQQPTHMIEAFSRIDQSERFSAHPSQHTGSRGYPDPVGCIPGLDYGDRLLQLPTGMYVLARV